MGEYPGLSSGPNKITRVLISRKEVRGQSQKKIWQHHQGLEWCGLKMEEVAVSQGWPLRSWKKAKK